MDTGEFWISLELVVPELFNSEMIQMKDSKHQSPGVGVVEQSATRLDLCGQRQKAPRVVRNSESNQ